MELIDRLDHGSNMFVSRSALSRRWAADERAALARALHGAEA